MSEELTLMPEIALLRKLLGDLGASDPDALMLAMARAKTVPRVASVLIRAITEENALRAGVVGEDGLTEVVGRAIEEMEADHAGHA